MPRRPIKHTVDNYDYSKIDNLPNCKEEPVICPKCLDEKKKIRYGHKHEFLQVPYQETSTKIKARIVIVHTHFALLRGTQASAFDESRNVVCTIGETWKDKKEDCHITYRLKRKKPLPGFTKSDA